MNRNPLDIIKENSPELFENVYATRNLAFKDGALPAKQKILIALALDAGPWCGGRGEVPGQAGHG